MKPLKLKGEGYGENTIQRLHLTKGFMFAKYFALDEFLSLASKISLGENVYCCEYFQTSKNFLNLTAVENLFNRKMRLLRTYLKKTLSEIKKKNFV